MKRLLGTSILALVACSDGGTAPNPDGGAAATGTFSAVIDGQSWVSTTNQSVGSSPGPNQVPGLVTFTGTRISGSTNSTTLLLTVGYIAGPGSYPLGVNFISTAGGIGQVSTTQGSAFGNWATNFPGNAGTLTVTSLTSNRLVGTFQFSAFPQAFTAATGTKVVTNGVIDMPLPAGFTPAPANNRGSRMSATLGGASWNAAAVVALGANNVFVLGGTNDSYSINLQPRTAVTAGTTYPIGGPSPAWSMSVIRMGASQNWTSGTGGPVGSVTVTSLGGNRATGTFSATLAGGAGTTGALAITNGTFDVRVDSP